jgi:mannose-1-phosphate guanylyltransferase
MRAVVLVGGFGTRLRPLTYTVPKPMLPVGHLPIIERLVANLVRGGVTDVTLALGFKPEPFLEAFPDGTCAGAQLHYAVEPEPLDTAGAIRFAAEAAGIDETFVVVNGDVLTDLDIATLVDFHRARGAEATLHLIAVPDPSAFGVVALDDVGRVERFVEKPPPGTEPSNLVNAGTYVLDARCRSSARPSLRSSLTAACSRWPPTTTGSTRASRSSIWRPTSICSVAGGPTTTASRWPRVPSSTRRQP